MMKILNININININIITCTHLMKEVCWNHHLYWSDDIYRQLFSGTNPPKKIWNQQPPEIPPEIHCLVEKSSPDIPTFSMGKNRWFPGSDVPIIAGRAASSRPRWSETWLVRWRAISTWAPAGLKPRKMLGFTREMEVWHGKNQEKLGSDPQERVAFTRKTNDFTKKN